MSKKIKVKIAVPSAKCPEADTMQCISYLMAYSLINSNQIDGGLTINLDCRKSSLLPHLRNSFVNDAIADNNDYLLFIDDDMVFPPELLIEFLKAKKPVVACNCVTKSDTHSKFTALGLDYKMLMTLPNSEGLQEVSAVGTGIMLIDLKIFKRLKMPYFMLFWDKVKERMMGEDYYFCGKLLSKKIPMFIHHGMSKETFHIGTKKYSINDAIKCLKDNGIYTENSTQSSN